KAQDLIRKRLFRIDLHGVRSRISGFLPLTGRKVELSKFGKSFSRRHDAGRKALFVGGGWSWNHASGKCEQLNIVIQFLPHGFRIAESILKSLLLFGSGLECVEELL